MFSQPPNLELKDPYKEYVEEIPKGIPYEEPPDIIDVDKIQAEDREKVMRRYAVLSSLAYDIYNKDLKTAESSMKEHLPHHEIIPELTDGYSTTIIKRHENKPDDVIISYRGSANAEDAVVDLVQIATGSPMEKLFGKATGRFKLSNDKFNAVKNKFPDANITTTGHSLGGSLAYFIGKSNDVPSYIFNAGSSPVDVITETGIKHTDKNQSTHYYVVGDIVGASKSLIHSKDKLLYGEGDKLVPVKAKDWLWDLIKSLGKTLGHKAVETAVGSLVGGPPKTIISGISTLHTLGEVGKSVGNYFINLHGVGNFMPDEAFKNKLDEKDLLFRWIKPIETYIDQQNKISKRGVQHDFTAPISKKEFFDKISKICNPADPLSSCYKKPL